jgi:nucleotide-binding universal stress UspA family protein
MSTAELTTPAAVRTILFATDFSDAAQRAQTYATGLANRLRAKLVVAHANEPPNYGLRPENWRAANEQATAKMHELQRKLTTDFPGFPSEFCVDEGSAWHVVASLLDKHQVDLIVVGTRGRTGAGKLLLGSQAEEIFRQAPCPVLTVGPHAIVMTGRENELGEVLYATDFSPESRASALFAIGLALALQAHLNLLHVVEEQKTYELVRPEEVLISSERLLRSLIPEEAHFWRQPRSFAERGEPVQKILELADRVHAGLIVLGARKPAGMAGAATHLGAGVAYKVACSAACPVLTMRG